MRRLTRRPTRIDSPPTRDEINATKTTTYLDLWEKKCTNPERNSETAANGTFDHLMTPCP